MQNDVPKGATVGIIGVGNDGTVGHRLIRDLQKLGHINPRILFSAKRDLEGVFSDNKGRIIEPKKVSVAQIAEEADLIVFTYASRREDHLMSPSVREERFNADYRNFHENLRVDLRKAHAQFLVITNPTDFISYYAYRALNLDPVQFLGFGQDLEAKRARNVLLKRYTQLGDLKGLLPLGEHSARHVLVWSNAEVLEQGSDQFTPFKEWYLRMAAQGQPVDLRAIDTEAAGLAIDWWNKNDTKTYDNMAPELLATIRAALTAQPIGKGEGPTFVLSRIYETPNGAISTGLPTQFYRDGDGRIRNRIAPAWAADAEGKKFNLSRLEQEIWNEQQRVQEVWQQTRKLITDIDDYHSQRVEVWEKSGRQGEEPLPRIKERKRKALIHDYSKILLCTRGQKPLTACNVQDALIETAKYCNGKIVMQLEQGTSNIRSILRTVSLDGKILDEKDLTNEGIRDFEIDENYIYVVPKQPGRILRWAYGGTIEKIKVDQPLELLAANETRIYGTGEGTIWEADRNNLAFRALSKSVLGGILSMKAVKWGDREVIIALGTDGTIKVLADGKSVHHGRVSGTCFDARVTGEGKMYLAYNEKSDGYALVVRELNPDLSISELKPRLQTSVRAQAIALDNHHMLAYDASDGLFEVEMGINSPRKFDLGKANEVRGLWVVPVWE